MENLNRIIKFRAWDKNKKEMTVILNKFISFTGIIWENLRDGLEDIDKLVSSQRFIVQQFTGLEDKNGKEIYDGDIIDYGIKFSEFTELYRGKVFFENGSYKVDGDEINCEYHLISKCNYIKIIGNIYENPELLK